MGDYLGVDPSEEIETKNLEDKVNFKKQNKYLLIFSAWYITLSAPSISICYEAFSTNGFIYPPYSLDDFFTAATSFTLAYSLFASTWCCLKYKRNKKYLNSLEEEVKKSE